MRWRDARRRGGEKLSRCAFLPAGRGNSTPRSGNDWSACCSKGSLAYGYRTNLWTTARIAGLVEQENLGLSYHRDHIGRLMHSLGWSVQKPERRALERDEGTIRPEAEEWPRIKKTPRGWAPT